MPRARNPNRDKAKQIWTEHQGNITNRQIAEMLNESEKVVAVWKQRDQWNVVQQSDESCTTNNRNRKNRLNKSSENSERSGNSRSAKQTTSIGGAPIGNKNAVGHGAPKSNNNAVSHGFFRKIFPDDEDTLDIINEISVRDPIQILWENIVIQYTAIARAQRLMFVKDQDDLTKVLKRQKESSSMNGDSWEKEYELQFAWDKHAAFLNAQSRAISTLEGLITKYESLLPSSLKMEKQRLELDLIKAEIAKVKDNSTDKTIVVDLPEGFDVDE